MASAWRTSAIDQQLDNYSVNHSPYINSKHVLRMLFVLSLLPSSSSAAAAAAELAASISPVVTCQRTTEWFKSGALRLTYIYT